MKIYREVGSLYIVNRKDAEGYERPVYEIEVDEAEPVRHGHWIRNDNGTCSCSECQSWVPNEQYYYARYCLHCGAKMDGGT